MSKQKAAVDFGSGKIALAVGEETPSGIRIVSYNEEPSAGVRNGEIQNNGKVEQIVTSLLQKAAQDTGREIDSASVTLSVRALHCSEVRKRSERLLQADSITDREIDALSEEAFNSPTENGETVFEVAPQSYDVDDSIGITRSDAVGMEGRSIEASLMVISGNGNQLEKRRNVLDACGLKLERAILSPTASARATVTTPEAENGVALVDIGCGTTEVVIIRDNIVRDVIVIPFAGYSITSDIKEETSTSLRWAEKVKLEYGCCCEEYVPENKKLVLKSSEGYCEGEIDLTLLSRVIEARLSEILHAVRYFLDNSKYSTKIPSGVVLTGGTCYMENIRQLAKAILGRKVRLAAPVGITADSREGALDAGSSAAVGAVLEAFSPVFTHRVESSEPERKDTRRENTDGSMQMATLFDNMGMAAEKKPKKNKERKKKTETSTKGSGSSSKKDEAKEEGEKTFWDKLFGPANDNA